MNRASGSIAHRLVLTGASGGLGQAIARALAPRSNAMLLAGRDTASLVALQSELISLHPHLTVAIISGDLRETAPRERLLAAAHQLDRPIDLLINNAGTSDFHAFDSQHPNAIEQVLAVNLTAPMLLTQTLLPLLKRAERAQIVNIGSVFGSIGYPGFAAYCASKFGLRGFTQSLRRELADSRVAVRYFAPRAIRTGLNSVAVNALNRALNTTEDAPDHVARELLAFLDSRSGERTLGFPERLYVLLNRLAPAVNDRAIRAQLPVIRDHLPDPKAPIRFAKKE